MKSLLFALGGIAAAAMLSAPTKAQNCPSWAQYGGGMGGTTNCGFMTFQQR